MLFEPYLHNPEHMHMDPFKYVIFLHECLKDVCQVLGHDSKSKWAFGATTGAEIMTNKMHHFSSDFICYATSKVNAYGM